MLSLSERVWNEFSFTPTVNARVKDPRLPRACNIGHLLGEHGLWPKCYAPSPESLNSTKQV